MSDPRLVALLWALANAVGLIVHGWLIVQTWLDWRVSARAVPVGQAEPWRETNAWRNLLGQLGLLLPRGLNLTIGLVSLSLPPATSPAVSEIVAWMQLGLILSEWITTGAGFAFWWARRALP